MIGNGPFIDLIIEVLQHEIRGVADRFRHHATELLVGAESKAEHAGPGAADTKKPNSCVVE